MTTPKAAISGAGGRWLIGTVLLALAGCKADQPPAPMVTTLPTGEQLKIVPVNIADTRAVSGEVTSRDQAEARARIAGTLVNLRVRAGDQVTRGQRIGTVTDTRLGYESSTATARVAAAQAEALRAGAELGRIEDLYRNQVYAKARLDSAIAMASAADAQLDAARAQAGASMSVAGQGAVLAPATGRVIRADVPAGSVVSPGQSLATVAAGPIILRLLLPESLASGLRIDTPITLSEPIDGVRSGRISQIYPSITAGQIMVDASVPGISDRFIGRRLGATLEIGRRNAIVVPRRFMTTRFGIDYVDVVANRTLSAVPVQATPLPDSDTVEILAGVGAGDIIYRAADTAR